MSYFVPKEIPNCCGRCPCFHAEHPMYCQAVKADKNKRIYAPYGEGRPDWCPLIEIPTPHGRLIDADDLIERINVVIEHGLADPDGLHPLSAEVVLETINVIPTVAPEPHWIPVTERLPETDDAVLTTYIVNGDRSKRYVEESTYYRSSESWSSVWDEYRIGGMRIEVIAWMPMPKPYKGVTDN